MQNLVIDISKRGVIPPIIVTEYDSMSRFFELRLLNNGADYVPPENANYSVWYETNDSKGWYDTITLPDETSRPAVVEDGNVLTVEIAEAATTSCGELAVMVTGDGGYQLTVAGIRLASADVPGYDGAEVEDYYNVYIADMQKNAARAENAAQTAIEYGATIDVDEAEEELIIDHYDDAGEVETWATVSEAWAVGKRNGVDVPSTDETYHNNSKYYAGQAANSAVNSAASAETAEEAAELCFTTAIKTSASGAVASFSDGADNIPMQSLIAEITPVQSGSGDPSPTNIRPISGRTGLTVTAANKNLAPNMAGQESTTSNGITFTYNDDGSVTLNGTATGSAFSRAVSGISSNIRFPFGTYKKPVINLGNNLYIGLYVQYMESSSSWVTVEGGGLARDPFVIDRDIPLAIRVGVTAGTTVDNYRFEPYIYPESISDTTWVSPVKREYPITWQTEAGTVYGGTLDVISGVLTVDRASVDMGTLAWRYFTSGDYFYCPVDGKALGNQNVISSIYATSSGSATTQMTDYQIKGHGTSNTVYVKDSRYTAAADLITALSGQTMVYELATPQTYQLTPTEVRTILGVNNLCSDAGDVSVEYVADTKMYIDGEIAELQALMLEN